MNPQLPPRAISPTSFSRRKFLQQSSTAAIGFSIIPRHVLGGPGYVPPSDKINVAFIGVGAQGLRVMLHFLREPDVQGVAVCDVNKSSDDYPQWEKHEFCNSVRKLLGVDSGWDWLSPDPPIQLTRSLHVTSGVPVATRLRKLSMPITAARTVLATPTAVPPTPTSANYSTNKKISMPSSSAPPTTCTPPFP